MQLPANTVSVPDTVLPPSTAALSEQLIRLLDQSLQLIQAGNSVHGVRLLAAPLTKLWMGISGSELATTLLPQCRAHRVFEVAQRDPFTNRASTKPRGYAGDAVMMDYLYRGVPYCDDMIGKSIFTCTTRASTGLSVCFRRQLLRSLIDDTVSGIPQARILSVASGHAREIDGSLVTSPMFDGEFLAVDQDAMSCAEVAHNHNVHRVTTVNMGVVDFIKNKATEVGKFDLIYSAGLYDYLSDVLARRLTRRLYEMLRPGGRLLIANFVPETVARAYMEIFMDWHLIYRTEEEMKTLARTAGAKEVRTFLDPHRNVVYAELTKPA